MQVTGVNNGNEVAAPSGSGMQVMDTVSKNIQSQIMNVQSQMQQLSSNQEMTMEEKMKKRQELQQQISELNNQLRQHQVEVRKEKQEANREASDEVLPEKEDKETKTTGMSENSMKAMISADGALEGAQKQGSLKSAMQGKAGVLEAEIESDAARGVDVTGKQGELQDIEKRLSNVSGAQIEHLGKASNRLQEAAKADADEEKTNQYRNVQNGAAKQTDKANTFIKNLKSGQKAAANFNSVDIHI
ncbi:MAG: FlxA-like family protein [Butyribacter sp.]|nr:FlxA-like family protein [Butyribacter sp.]